MDPAQDTESLVRLTANSAEREEKEEGGDEVVGKCEEVRRPMPQHVMEKKPPWMSSLLPTPLLPLPTLNFTVSQVTFTTNPAKPNLLKKHILITINVFLSFKIMPFSYEGSSKKTSGNCGNFPETDPRLPWLCKQGRL